MSRKPRLGYCQRLVVPSRDGLAFRLRDQGRDLCKIAVLAKEISRVLPFLHKYFPHGSMVMAALGGYLAVSYLAEQTVVDALDAVWRTSWQDATGKADWTATTPFGLLAASGVVAIDKPGIRFDATANAASVELRGACRFTCTLADVVVGGVHVEFNATVLLPVRIVPADNPLFKKTILDLDGFTIEAGQLALTWFDGPIGNAEPTFLGPEARAALTAELRRLAAPLLTIRLPTDQLYLAELALMTQGIPGSVILTPQIRLGQVRILAGWLAVGLDASSSIGTTAGNAALIGPPPDPPPPGEAAMPQAGAGLANARLIVDAPLLIAYLEANARLAVRFAVAAKPKVHPDTDNISVRFEDDTIIVHAFGTIDAPDPFPGNIAFTADVRIRPFIPANTRTVYASIKPKIDADTPFFLEILGTLADLFGADSFGELRRANASQMAVLFGVKISTKVPDAFGLYADLAARQLTIRPDFVGLFGEASLFTTFSEPDRDPTPTVYNFVGIRDRFLTLKLLNPRLVADPMFRVAWRIRRGSNGTEIASGTAWSGSERPFSPPVDLWDDANILETSYTIETAAERPPGHVVAQNVQSLKVIDPLDRSHPFTRWRKLHFFTPTGPLPKQPIIIHSAIHRTAIRERCKFSDLREGRFGTTYVMQPLDTLPAPEDPGFATRLCPYCFR